MIKIKTAGSNNRVFSNPAQGIAPSTCALCFDGVNDIVDYTYQGTEDWVSWGVGPVFSYSMWIKQSAEVKASRALLFESNDLRSPVGLAMRIVINSSNRVIVHMQDPVTGDYARRQFSLHDNPTTGVNSYPGFVAGVGGVDSDGYVHIGFAIDLSAAAYTTGVPVVSNDGSMRVPGTAYNMFKCFWNGVELDGMNDAWGDLSSVNRTAQYLIMGDTAHLSVIPKHPFYGCMDEIYAYDTALSAADFASIHAAGRLGANPVGGWVTAWKFENGNINDVNNLWSSNPAGPTINCT